MDSSEFTSGRDERQIEIDRRRVSAIRDFEDALDRARDDLAFEIVRVISKAIDDVTGDDPSACASYSAEQAVKRAIKNMTG